MMEWNEEQRRKAAGTKSAAELLELASSGGMSMTPKEAERLFTKLHPPAGELSDRELDAVTGGGCGGGGGGGISQPSAPSYAEGIKLGLFCEGCGCDCWKPEITTACNQSYKCAVCYGGTATISRADVPKSIEYVRIDRSTVRVKPDTEPMLGMP